VAGRCEEKGCQDETSRPADMCGRHEKWVGREKNKSTEDKDLYGVHVECFMLSREADLSLCVLLWGSEIRQRV
jgi:hypothetical protein